METAENIVQMVKADGPLLPVFIANKIHKSILIASALLSEAASSGQIKISSVKVGGSPLYYAPGQEYKLQNYADKLNEKQKKAYDLLNQKQILRDSEQIPVVRVALREIKDFAKPIKAKSGEIEEIFWRWFLLPQDEAEKIITGKKEDTEKQPKPEPSQTQLKPEHKHEEKVPTPKEPETQKNHEDLKPIPKPEAVISEKNEELVPIPKLIPPSEPQSKPVQALTGDGFVGDVLAFFTRNDITVKEQTCIKKSTEFDFVIKVPSAIGKLVYFAKAKKKKRYNEADIASAYTQGQLKKLPALLIITGDLTKKAKELLDIGIYSVVVKRID